MAWRCFPVAAKTLAGKIWWTSGCAVAAVGPVQGPAREDAVNGALHPSGLPNGCWW